MAKTRRRYRRARSRWSANIQTIGGSGTAQANNIFVDFQTICQGPAQNENSTSQVYTVKNIEVSAILESLSTGSNASQIDNVTYYIIYVPEGYGLDADLPYKHPEWIMAYKFVGTIAYGQNPAYPNVQTPKIKTRLSRRLNTGDSIQFMISGYNNTVPQEVSYNGLVRWWTKAN